MWDEVGDGCFRRRYRRYDLNIGVVHGAEALLVIEHAGRSPPSRRAARRPGRVRPPGALGDQQPLALRSRLREPAIRRACPQHARNLASPDCRGRCRSAAVGTRRPAADAARQRGRAACCAARVLRRGRLRRVRPRRRSSRPTTSWRIATSSTWVTAASSCSTSDGAIPATISWSSPAMPRSCSLAISSSSQRRRRTATTATRWSGHRR